MKNQKTTYEKAEIIVQLFDESQSVTLSGLKFAEEGFGDEVDW